MPATTAGVVKALIESAGLGVAAYRDAAPRDAPLPYVTVREQLASTADRDGAYDRDVTHTQRETISVDVWQPWRDPTTGQVRESYTLVQDVRRALHGRADVSGTPWRVYGLRVESSARLLEAEANVVHTALTVTVHREA